MLAAEDVATVTMGVAGLEATVWVTGFVTA